ncbi:MAG: hypothetical protein EAZ14_12195, partial [Runella slithyformis]
MQTRAFFIITVLSMLATQLRAQSRLYANTALQLSDMTQNGTARVQGMGGNHVALGGDASTIFGNPAGLGFYNRSEFSLSPGFNMTNKDANYIGNSTKDSRNGLN